jgi:serine protease AprX
LPMLLLSACGGGSDPSGSGPRLVERPGAARTSEAMDQDRNKIFDVLDRVMNMVGDKDLIPVIILLEGPHDIVELERVAGPLDLKHQFRIVPALAAKATRDQIRALARLSFVRQVEWDAPVTVLLDGSNRWFGSEKARQDFGVDGDRDGNPARYTKSDVVVAVIDTGIDPRHVDLDGGKILGWKDWVNGRSEPYDDHGHGTHVASIVAGTGEGNAAYAGVAPGAALVGLKVLDAGGSGSLSNVAAAVDWCVENKEQFGIRVISVGSSKLTPMRGAGRPRPARFVSIGCTARFRPGQAWPVVIR